MIAHVSVNLVTYNEEHRVERWLDAISSHVDSIVIVDQSSTDNTCDVIANWKSRQLNPQKPAVQIVLDKHHGYCEASRKLAWSHSPRSSWVLVLDADERISPEFIAEMRQLDRGGRRGVRMKRAFYLGGEHRFTGDYQYRFFRHDSAKFLNEIHTEPQPTTPEKKIYSTPYVAIIHEKSWREQIDDEQRYEEVLKNQVGPLADRKRGLNVHIPLVKASGLAPEEIDRLTLEERKKRGL